MPRRRFANLILLIAVWAAAFAAAADERTLYKSVLRNGRIVYGDEPAANARSTEQIKVERHAADPQEAEAAQRALGLTRAQLLRDAAARAARLKQLDNAVLGAYADLMDADARRVQGRDIQEGDRRGRRLLAPYGQRQRDLQAESDQKRRRLEALLRERAALQ